MPKILNYSIVGLEDYTISFESYCSLCDIQQFCKYGKEEPFSIKISCGDLNRAKEKVKFVRLDIEEEDIELRELDLVLFRNVLIYMEKTFQEKTLLMIYNRLNEKAFLVLGKVEYLVGETKSLFNIVDSRERIYRKC